jgi:hypothetical protein
VKKPIFMLIVNGQEIWFDNSVKKLKKDDFCKVVGNEIFKLRNKNFDFVYKRMNKIIYKEA